MMALQCGEIMSFAVPCDPEAIERAELGYEMKKPGHCFRCRSGLDLIDLRIPVEVGDWSSRVTVGVVGTDGPIGRTASISAFIRLCRGCRS